MCNVPVIFFHEVGLEVDHGVLRGRFVFLFVDDAVEDASFNEDSEH